MKDFIREIIDKSSPRQDNENRLREYIQKYLLYILYRKKIYHNLIFTGGTALRFLFKIRRFSEDLDFSLSEKAKGYNFLKILEMGQKELILAGYKVEIKYSLEKTVHNAFLKFPDLLYEYGISPHKDEKISIKIEIDTSPPLGGKEEVTLYDSIFMFYILHYDLPSLFAGKLHALLCREYTKGRDWYDLLWYLTNFRDLEPNFVMLNNAIKQTFGRDIEIRRENWKKLLKKEVDELDVEKVRGDVGRFLENHADIEFLNKENLYRSLRGETGSSHITQ
ncbi:MAG: hypothetical protein COT45_00375 [bacterium (Candidatus Stahlbacteria) CG08_land_8_20_14_0_20_40_26]|nr:MAG: hypothetical protein COX49_00360 [bacterium (Candidatus Stahlbacteria) CG23_combo_of_CG06-09_8_20_14_all_40_9]PIS26697.1 MAG: hypothetical protein COT45_00375 [bacterium (Candidatus Stahlbacteria) CG08_land_8_20_14_0_20_40_26]